MLLEWVDYFGLLFLAPFAALELFWRARPYEAAPGWRWRALAVTLGVFGFTFVIGRAWGAVLPQWSLIDGAALGTWRRRGGRRACPLDAALFTTWAVIAFYPMLGLTPEAGAIASAFLAFNAAFQRANIRTPRWLGYLIQRPESHGIHHGRGIHRWNYADLPLWDMVFGTFRNPASAPSEAGFYNGASARLGGMLSFAKVA